MNTKMRTMTISLSLQQADRIQRAVATGHYASNSEVLREALRGWEQREDLRELEMARLKSAYAEGIASGEGRDIAPEALLAKFKSQARRRG